MARPVPAETAASRRWGTRSALSDEDDARSRLIAAASRCIIRRGDADIRMAEVAHEAGVVRSTVYRYFTNRDDLLQQVVVHRSDRTFGRIARSLPHPDDAAASLPDLILEPLALVDGNRLNEALFAPGSRALVTAVELESEPMVDALHRNFGPLFEQWQEAGQIHADLDIRETIRWMNAVALLLLMPPWRTRSWAEKRAFLETYLVRALVTAI